MATSSGNGAAAPANPAAVAKPELPEAEIEVKLSEVPTEQLEAMLAAGYEIRECNRVLKKVNANIVGEVLKDQGTFYEQQHYPKGDVYDRETHAQYYYHAHRPESGEHGHFHTFLRASGMPDGVEPVPNPGEVAWPSGNDALSHLVAISMDKFGVPIALFTTNRWVTGETWYPAATVIRMLDRFNIDHAWPSWPTNRWITAMFTLFRPQIEVLIEKRDATVAAWRADHPGKDVFEDRDLEITSIAPVSVDDQLKAVEAALEARGA